MPPHRPVSTYSIVARDLGSGALGVAVQSHWFSVGSVVPWAETGAGAVATQAFAEPAYGPRGLDLMRQGVGAREALQRLISEDPRAAVRQVAFLDASGEVATHTGEQCIAEAGHLQGDGFCVQANMMSRPTVWTAMADAYQNARGDLPDRMLAALYAAEDEGGDIRGRQSAAIVVVTGESSGRPWEDRLFDLRVEDHPDPLEELTRLLQLRRAYIAMDEGDDALAAKRIELALEKYSLATQLMPGNPEMPFWKAVGLTGAGSVDEALPVFREVFAADDSWKTLLHRLVDTGLLDIDRSSVERIRSL